jgi:hypothetical protein
MQRLQRRFALFTQVMVQQIHQRSRRLVDYLSHAGCDVASAADLEGALQSKTPSPAAASSQFRLTGRQHDQVNTAASAQNGPSG